MSYHTNTHTHTHTQIHTYTHTTHTPQERCDVKGALSTGGRRLMVGFLIFIGHFLQKRPIFSGSFVENDLQLRGSYQSSPPCISCFIYVSTSLTYQRMSVSPTHMNLSMCVPPTSTYFPVPLTREGQGHCRDRDICERGRDIGI